MAGPAHGEPDDLVADSESADAGTDLDRDPGKVTALPGREGRRKHVAHSTVRIAASLMLMPAARTSTRTSPAPGTGRGTSRTSRTSMPP